MEPITTLLLFCLGSALCGTVPFALAVVVVVVLANLARAADGRGRRR